MDGREFRQVLSRFAAGVTVVSTLDGDGQRVGFTATAFSSVSIDPPLVLFCADKGGRTGAAFIEAPNFAISVLGSEQQHIALAFADKTSTDKFAGVPSSSGMFGLPLIDGAIATLVCERFSSVEAGDHTIYVGRVCDAHASDDAPLLHFRGAFHRVQDERRPAPSWDWAQLPDGW